MLVTISCSKARRRMRRLLVLMAQGHIFVITKNGREMCQLMGATPRKNRNEDVRFRSGTVPIASALIGQRAMTLSVGNEQTNVDPGP
ncbi:hypothetical protein EAH78_20370 [Pseudomonas arsenicoxydans]|uniref:Type II toxin-antitoxin system prevent-host-death family antitoxin n=1 Tax=Pseudomonas arsenicoxydans TaxID=702115 RepID=A0A502HR83_9PSED|nr:hypothetical protein EAH78_20370 [Pseudomonas arsenicoxydans]